MTSNDEVLRLKRGRKKVNGMRGESGREGEEREFGEFV